MSCFYILIFLFLFLPFYFQVLSFPLYCYFLDEYPENPLHDLITSKPWKFDININANQSIGFNVSLQNDAYFAAVQVHSFVNEIILEDNTGKLQCGTNLGYVNVVTSGNCVYFTVHNTNRFPVKILGFVTPYGLLGKFFVYIFFSGTVVLHNTV